MIPSRIASEAIVSEVYQRGLVIDSQLIALVILFVISVSKGIGD